MSQTGGKEKSTQVSKVRSDVIKHRNAGLVHHETEFFLKY